MDSNTLLELMRKQQEEHNKVIAKLIKDQQKQQADFQAQQAEVQKHQADFQAQQVEVQKQQASQQNVLIEMVKMMQNMGINPRADNVGDTSLSTGEISVPRLMAALSVRITEFRFDPDSESTFTRWYDRHKNIFLVDGEKLDDAARVRLLTEKLDNSVFERYKRQILPKEPENIKFEETVSTLKELFDVKISIFTNRYQCLNITKTSNEDFMEYTGRVNEACEKSKVYDMDGDQFKCILWIFGLKEAKYSDLRQRLMIVLDKAHTESKKLTIHDLYQEVDRFISLKQDSKMVENGLSERYVHAVTEKDESKPEVECWNCGRDHYVKECPKPRLVCRKCNKKGHMERYCRLAADRAKTRENKGSSQREFKANRKCNVVTIASATADVNVVRYYVDAEVNGHSVEFQVDTGSDITVIQENIWDQMGRPRLRKSNVVVKDASGRSMEIHGMFECSFKLRGSTGRGYVYVSPCRSLLGLSWIKQSERMNYYLEQIIAGVGTVGTTDSVREQRNKDRDIFREDGDCPENAKCQTSSVVKTSSRIPRKLKGEGVPELRANLLMSRSTQEYKTGDVVSVRECHGLKWKWVRGKVLERLGTVKYLIQIRNSVYERYTNQIRKKVDSKTDMNDLALNSHKDMYEIQYPDPFKRADRKGNRKGSKAFAQ